MSIFVKDGIPIPVHEFTPKGLKKALPKPQVEITRNSQLQDAWCYAACAAMVIFKCTEVFTRQCKVVEFVKDPGDCCKAKPDAVCIRTGCEEEDIKEIFTEFEVNSKKVPGNLTKAEMTTEIIDSTPGRPIEVVINWRVGGNKQSAHALLINGISGQYVHLVDPLKRQPFGGWKRIVQLETGFGHGRWKLSWIELKKLQTLAARPAKRRKSNGPS